MTPRRPSRLAAGGLRHARRASLYVAVLMTALLVTVIGLSGLALARVQFRTLQGESDLLRADAYARAALHYALLPIAATNDWRTRFVSDRWRRPAAFESGWFSWRLIDSEDGDPDTTPDGPFRLEGKGVCGIAVRNWSVLVDARPPGNLLENGDFASADEGWTAQDCELRYDAVESRLELHSRQDYEAGLLQDVLGQIRNDRPYTATIEVVPEGQTRRYRVNLMLGTSGGPVLASAQADLPGDQATLTLQLQPAWGGVLQSATFHVCAPTDTNDLRLKGVALRETAECPVRMIPGTLRREPDETLYQLDPVDITPTPDPPDPLDGAGDLIDPTLNLLPLGG